MSERDEDRKASALAGDTVLVINSGSSSVKFALFAALDPSTRLWAGAIEQIGQAKGRLHATDERGQIAFDRLIGVPDHETGLALLFEALEQNSLLGNLVAVGHRIVHGGADYASPMIITPDLEMRLRQLVPLAPLHQPHNLAGIAAVRVVRSNLTQIACFDTAFHRSLPLMAKLTGLPRKLFDEGIQRIGFHGLSYEYIIETLRQRGVDISRERIVIAHLGNGASMCAIQNGKSIETTMGFSALAGLPMGTRCGDLDPGIILYLISERQMTIVEVQALLYEESGLLGLSGLSRNMQDLLANADNRRAAEAIDYFCYQARRHLTSLTGALGGLDRIVFTGGIGANAPKVRATICEGLSYIGVQIDPIRNGNGDQLISIAGAAVTVEVLPTDEELMIAMHVRDVLCDHRLMTEEV